ncbi:MAG TPA: hypothetical protein DIW31_02850 [Bacteroidales bacterium]|nr:hypothetical protein [Bacteroidales bacterium]
MNSNNNKQMEEESLDIKKYIFLILSNWYWFAISIFLGLFIAYFINRYSINIYSVQSSLIVRDDESPNSFSGAENLIQGLKLTRNTKSVQNEIGILKSYSLAYKAVSELEEFNITYMGVGRRRIVESELYTRSPFKVTLEPNAINLTEYPINVTILSKDKYLLEIDDKFDIKKEMKWGEPFKSELFNFTIIIRKQEYISDYIEGTKFYFLIRNLNYLANEYRGKLSVELNDKKGSILILTTNGPVAEKESDYQNQLMKAYIQKGLDEKNRIAENTIRFIDLQLSNMTDSLKFAEKRLQDFRSTNKVINLGKEGSILYENLQNLQEEKGKAELKANYYSYLKKYLDEKKDLRDLVAPSSIGVEDTQLASILNELSQAYIEQETLKLSANPLTPGLKTYTLKLETLKNTLIEKVKSLIEVNLVTLNEIDRRMNVYEIEMSKIPFTERLLIGFEREFNLINKMYNYLNEKRAEASIAKASNIADNKILDNALPLNATIVKPNRRMVTVFGFMAGAMIPIIIIVIIGYFNTTIDDIRDIQGHTSLPILGLIGHNNYDTELPVGANPKSALAESFRGLRTNLNYILRESNKKVITITSTISGEGKTFIAANLALIIALTGKKVLLVGLDLRKPKINNLFNTTYQNGLSTYLIGKDEFNSIVYQTKYDNLFMAPSGPIPPNPAELIGTSRMDQFIAEAKNIFDYIIIDTPPIAIVTDTLIANRFTDALLYITRFNYTNREALNLVESLKLSEDKLNIALVVNDFISKRRYGYNYGYSYGLKYGYKYQYTDSNDYYSDEEPPLTLKEKIVRFFS